MKIYNHLFDQIVSAENLFSAWDAFKLNKRNKKDVMEFEWDLEKNIFNLSRELKSKLYKHGPYVDFYITDPKRRHVHKASARDRILHHAIFKVINPIFEETFTSTSFSCRENYGTHRGVETLSKILRKVSQNGTRSCFVLKCDVKKFFATVDHGILYGILKKRIKDQDTLWLLNEVIESFASEHSNLFEKKGLPIGNLTSQLFANVYMNEFDQFMKNELRIKYYLRYTDDFVIVSDSEKYLKRLIPKIKNFLETKLSLSLHPEKVYIRRLSQGIDFLGYLNFLNHRQMRARTERRIFIKLKARVREFRADKISKLTLEQSLNSFLGVMSHANTWKISQRLQNQFWYWLNRNQIRICVD